MPQLVVAAAAAIGNAVIAVTGSATLAAAAANTVAALGFAQGVAAGLSAWATVASIGAIARGRPKVGGPTGSPVDFKADPSAGIPYAIGQTGVGGNIIFATTAETKNHHLLYLTVLTGAGPIEGGATQFYVNDVLTTFTGTAANGFYHNFMERLAQPGSTTPAAFMPPATTGGALPEWTTSHKLTGFAADWWVLEYDTKKYPTGTPKRIVVDKWVKAYDPRLDSTYPGGSGPHRSNDETTWAWTANPFLHALTWCIGRYQNGKRILGIGAAIAMIDVAAFVEGANVADANGWQCHGLVYSTDRKAEVLAAMLQAGGGWPTRLGAKISCGVNAPKVSLATLTGDDQAGGEVTIAAARPRRDKFNAVIPRYRSPAHHYEAVPASRIEFASYLAEDGGVPRTCEPEFVLCQAVNQAAQLGSYVVANSREFGPITIPAKPRWWGYKPNDCVTIDEPEWGLNGQKCLILDRSFDPTSGIVTLSLLTETDAKHAAALAATGTAPPTPSLTGIDPTFMNPPAAGVFTLNGDTIPSGDGVTAIPALIVTGIADNPYAAAILVQYRQSGGSWVGPLQFDVSATRMEITGVTAGTNYDVQVAYLSIRGVPSAYLSLGTATAGVFRFPTPAVANRVRYSKFERGTSVGWETGANPSSLVVADASTPDPPGLNGYAVRISTITFTAGAQTVEIREDDALPFAVQAGERLCIQSRVLTAGPCTAQTFVVFLDSAGAAIGSPLSAFTIAANTPFATLKFGFVTAPAGAVKAYITTTVTSTAGGTGFYEFAQPMASGATATATDCPPWTPGLDTEPGADITATHTSADTAVGVGTNVVVDALFNLTDALLTASPSWQERTVSPSLALTYAAGTSGGVRTLQALRSGSGDATTRTVNLGGALAAAVACLPTDRIEASVYIQTNDVDLVTLFVRCWDVSGSFLGDVQVAQRVGGNAGTFSAGTAQRLGGIVSPLANTRRVALLIQSRFFGGGANSNVNIGKPYLGKASAGQTALTPWTPGIENQPGADVTLANYSAGFTGMGPFATEQTPVAAVLRPEKNILLNSTGVIPGFRFWATTNGGGTWSQYRDGYRGWGFAWTAPSAASYSFSLKSDNLATGAGQVLTAQGQVDTNLTTGAGLTLAIACYNSGGTFISDAATMAYSASSSGYFKFTGTTPAGTANVKFEVRGASVAFSGSGGSILAYKLMLQQGANASPWNDAATDEYLYGGTFGLNLTESVGGPVATNANYRTADGYSAGFTGMGGLAWLNSIGSTQIDSGAVTTPKLAAGAVLAGNIAAGQINAGHMSVSSLSAITANIGTATAGIVQNSAGTTFFDLTNSRAQFAVGSYRWRQGAIGSGVVAWFGPSSVALGSETRTNGVFAFGDDGVVYKGSADLDTLLGGGSTFSLEFDDPADAITTTTTSGSQSTNVLVINPTGHTGAVTYVIEQVGAPIDNLLTPGLWSVNGTTQAGSIQFTGVANSTHDAITSFLITATDGGGNKARLLANISLIYTGP